MASKNKTPPAPAPAASTNAESQVSTPRQSAEYRVTCTNCRQRKVKCSRSHPCVACERSGLPCVFPDRARLPRGRKRGSKSTNGEILKRLNKLEELLANNKNGQGEEASFEAAEHGNPRGASSIASQVTEKPGQTRTENTVGVRTNGEELDEEGLDRYLGSTFWRSLTNEVEGLRQTLDEDSGEDENTSITPDGSDTVSRPARVFGSNGNNSTLRSLHPSPSHIQVLYDSYVHNVDPVFKVLHIPTLQRLVLDTSNNLDVIKGGRSMEALLFSMYYSAITSLSPQDCLQSFQEDKNSLLARYRWGVEMALDSANFLSSTELVTLQALVIFLICVRCDDDTRYSWTLTSVAIRIGHALGLNRESPGIAYSPFMKEQRRRLWWQICTLDTRSSEDRGSDNMILEITFNTLKPLNINDADMSFESEQIVERVGHTEMTFSLISHEVSTVIRRFNFLPMKRDVNEESTVSLTFEAKSALIAAVQQRVESKYLAHGDTNDPIAFASTTVTRLVMCRMWLGLYHPFQQEARVSSREGMTRERLLQTAIEILEYAQILETGPAFAQWAWLFNTWVQWHALAVCLATLCVQTEGQLVDRAWKIVDAVFERWAVRIADSRRGMLWRPIKKLMSKAQATRCKGIETTESQSIPYRSFAEARPLLFSPMDGLQPITFQPEPPTVDPTAGEMLANGVAQYQNGSTQALFPGFTLPDELFATNSNKTVDQINWTDWDELVRDFELETQCGGVTENLQQDLSNPAIWW